MAKGLKIRKLSSDDRSTVAAVRIMRTRLREFFSHWPNFKKKPTSAQLHALRISGKRLRYSAESLRELYPDRLALLLNLLRQVQDVLGEMQDYETQRAVIADDLARWQARQLKSRRQADPESPAKFVSDEVVGREGEQAAEHKPESDPLLRAMNDLLRDYQKKQEKRLAEFELLWRGISRRAFQDALRDLVSHPRKPARIAETELSYD